MADSWRNILERAAENLAFDLDQERLRRIRQQSARWRGRRAVPQPLSLPDLLAREREALDPGGKPALSSKARAARRFGPKYRKKGRSRGFTPVAVSVGIVALIAFGIYKLLH
jgi:hypothetical protein